MKNTASQIRRLSVDGTTYIPSGQCRRCRREAYSNEMAVLVAALTSRVADGMAVERVSVRSLNLELKRSAPVNIFDAMGQLSTYKYLILGA